MCLCHPCGKTQNERDRPHGGDDIGPGHGLQTPTPPEAHTVLEVQAFLTRGLRVPFFLWAHVTFIIRKSRSLDFLRHFNDYGPRIVWLAPCPSLPSRLQQGSRAPPGEPGPGTWCSTHPPRAAGGGCACPPLYSSACPLQLLQPLDEPICGDQRARGEGERPRDH